VLLIHCFHHSIKHGLHIGESRVHMSTHSLGTAAGSPLGSLCHVLHSYHFLLHDMGLAPVHCDVTVLGFVAGAAASLHGSVA
jgi:hypothetical protein